MESFAGNYLTDKNAISIYNDGATTATVKLSENILTLTKDGVPQTIDLTQEANDTLQKLVTVINALGGGWTATLLSFGSRASKDNMADIEEINCLGSDNLQILKTLFSDVSNWPSAYVAFQKKEKVDDAEEQIERITRDYFYANSFDVKLNGNGKDRIFFHFQSSILSVTSILVFGISIDSDLYTFDERSVFLDMTTATASWAEWRALKKELSTEVLFPAGDKNIQIQGTRGWSSCPGEIRKCAKIIIEDEFDETLYDHWREGVLSVGGDYRYQNPRRIHTGIMKADVILSRYIRKRPTLATTRTNR